MFLNGIQKKNRGKHVLRICFVKFLMFRKQKIKIGISKIVYGSLITLIFVLEKLVSRKLKIFNFFKTSFPRTKIRVIRLPYTIFNIPVFIFCLRNIKNFTKQIPKTCFPLFFVVSIKKHTIETA